jgi:hypothetical protein
LTILNIRSVFKKKHAGRDEDKAVHAASSRIRRLPCAAHGTKRHWHLPHDQKGRFPGPGENRQTEKAGHKAAVAATSVRRGRIGTPNALFTPPRPPPTVAGDRGTLAGPAASPWAMPACSQTAVASKTKRSNVCITVRKVLGEHPPCSSGRRRPNNSLRVSAPTPRGRPNTPSVATTRRMSQVRPASVSHHDDSGERSRWSMAWRWRGTLRVERPVRSARHRTLWVPCARIALNMTPLLAHNPLSVGPLESDCTLARLHALSVPDRYLTVPDDADTQADRLRMFAGLREGAEQRLSACTELCQASMALRPSQPFDCVPMALPEEANDIARSINNHRKQVSEVTPQHAHVKRFSSVTAAYCPRNITLPDSSCVSRTCVSTTITSVMPPGRQGDQRSRWVAEQVTPRLAHSGPCGPHRYR